MTRNLIVFLVISIFLAPNNILLASEDHAQVKATLKVVDEQNNPIIGARAGITFEEILVWDTKSIPVKGITNNKGEFTASGKSSNRIFWGADMSEFYPSNGMFIFTSIKNGHWEPWNPEVSVVLRKKENPVPMYARDTQFPFALIMPAEGKEIGFDLIEYDWVSPFGNGKNTDFIFKLDKHFINDKDYDCNLTITFPNKYDGIQLYREDRKYGSLFKLPRFAPDTGYLPKLVISTSWIPKKGIVETYREDNNYFFRIRSEEKDGKLIRAIYGKIQGDIGFEPRGRKTASILFKYYVNPDYTHNMEFGGNLFKGLNVGMD